MTDPRKVRAVTFGFESVTHALRAVRKYLGLQYLSLDDVSDYQLKIAAERSAINNRKR